MGGITINSNLSALGAQRQLSNATRDLSATFARLSSGSRITRASDDAAGLAISKSLDLDRRVYQQGIRNFNDGISITNVAEGAVEELGNIVVRIRELAVQAANGTLSDRQRTALDLEAQNLSEEFTRIVRTTEFNDIGLLSGESPTLSLQGGYGASGALTAGVGGAIGIGTFTGTVSYSAESTVTYSIATGDFNNDGNIDYLTGGYSGATGYSTVRLGNADGTFGAAVSYASSGSAVNQALAADFNGDGNLDILQADTNGTVTLRSGNGNGTFGAALSYQMDTTSYRLSVADLNNDGAADIISTGQTSGVGTVTVRLGNGNGTFKSSTSFQNATTVVQGIQLADLNGDSNLDVVTTGTSGGVGYLGVRFGTGSGSFGSLISTAVTGSLNISKPTLSDLNGDGILDVVMAATAGGGSAAVLFGRGDGTFGGQTTYTAGISFVGSAGIADVNGDGVADLLTTGDNGGFSGATLGIRLGNGNGTFASLLTYAISTGSGYGFDLTTADLNQDGVTDLLMGFQAGSGGQAVSMFANTVSGTSPILPFSLRTEADARQAIAPLTRKVAQLAMQRGAIGAYQSRISSAINTLSQSSESYAAAISHITDADVAEETAKLTRLNILQQSAAAVLAQANRQPQIALRLLSDI